MDKEHEFVTIGAKGTFTGCPKGPSKSENLEVHVIKMNTALSSEEIAKKYKNLFTIIKLFDLQDELEEFLKEITGR